MSTTTKSGKATAGSRVPTDVLSSRIEAAIDGRRVVACVMTTFVIDGTFVLDEVLRTLVPVTGSSGSTAARDDIATLLLEQQTRVACYFDATTPFAVDGPSRVPGLPPVWLTPDL